MLETKFYLAADKNGEVFIFNDFPERQTDNFSNEEIFWSGNGDEEKVLDKHGFYTAVGRLMNIPEELMSSLKWEDEPIEINISVTKK